MSNIIFNPELIQKYDIAGPRYTSYPTAVQFNQDFSLDDYQQQAAASNTTGRDLSLYFHIPFCDTICYYCACNKVITKNRQKAIPYLQSLHKEIALQAQLFDPARKVRQLHWGGGTPTFISHEQMIELMQVTSRHFRLLDDDSGEYSIEIDPREVSHKSIQVLRKIGFNRMSLGVQDFDPAVQQAVNRIQSKQQTLDAINSARQLGFKSISTDLIYGLPLQTADSFKTTLQSIIDINPDRISIFNYAHMPALFKPQRRINEADMPDAQHKLIMLQQTIEQLSDAGYVYIGMDHFAKPDDELTLAQQQGNLYRNFQGYATHADCDLVGLGMTSIGTINQSFAQNVKSTEEYSERINQDQLAITRGFTLNQDDLIRRDVIMQLICHFHLNFAEIETKHSIQFQTYFADELSRLKAFQQDELLGLSDQSIQVTPQGRLLIRNICMIFDRYINSRQTQARFSRAI